MLLPLKGDDFSIYLTDGDNKYEVVSIRLRLGTSWEEPLWRAISQNSVSHKAFRVG